MTCIYSCLAGYSNSPKINVNNTKMSELCKVPYPLYCCQCVDNEALLIAGGGGAAKTGVQNSVEILDLHRTQKKCIAEAVGQLDTTIHAVMNMSAVINSGSAKSNLCTVALGMGGKCCVYSISENKPVSKQSSASKRSDLTKRKRKTTSIKEPEPDGIKNCNFKLLFEIDVVSKEGAFQTSVRLGKGGKLVASGGSDGHVRAWKLPSKDPIFDIHGHSDDVTDIDISPDESQIVTASRDGKSFIWNAATGKKILELHAIWNVSSKKYQFRNSRFAVVPDYPDRAVLFTTHTPLKQGGKNDYCCVTKWAVKRDKEGKEVGGLFPVIKQHTGKEALSALTVSKDGTFVGIGFMEGSVAIYIAFSLQCAHRVRNLHSIFVTSLSFVNESPRMRAIVGDCDAALVSVSADRTCKMTRLASRPMFSLFLVLFLCVVTLAAAGFFINYYNLL